MNPSSQFFGGLYRLPYGDHDHLGVVDATVVTSINLGVVLSVVVVALRVVGGAGTTHLPDSCLI